MRELFIGQDSRVWTDDDMREALMAVEADRCETLFIHSDILFGKAAGAFRRTELLASLYGMLCDLPVKNLIFPTFTFSFCNGESYDVRNSRSYMGALSEYARKQSGRYRTEDPLLSVSVPQELEPMYSHPSRHSLGEGSALDTLHHMNDVKFLFFGAEMANCFTYVHYVEKLLSVPYRFDMPFEGEILYPDGRIARRTQVIHTQCRGAKLPAKYDYFEKELEEKGLLKKRSVGDRYIACISEADAYREIRAHIEKDRNYFLAEPLNEAALTREYTYNKHDGRITHC